VTPSWRRKLDRAKHHLGHFQDRIAPIKERRTYPAPKTIEPYNDGIAYVYRLQIPEPDDPLLPILAGDLMFNLRSALDHVLVAVVPEDKVTRHTAFPIFTDDINERDASGKYVQPKARQAFRRKTSHVPQRAMAAVEWAQPYNLERQGLDPQYGALAILSAFQNADKHRQLVLLSSGLRAPVVWQVHPDGHRVRVEPDPPLPPNHVLGDRAEVGASLVATQVKMEAEGALDILIGNRLDGPYHACPDALEAMIRNVEDVLARFEALPELSGD
jgi:hypothetical protein